MQLKALKKTGMRKKYSLVPAQIEQVNDNRNEQTKPGNQENRVKELHDVKVSNLPLNHTIFLTISKNVYFGCTKTKTARLNE
jgi:hypothetical protein